MVDTAWNLTEHDVGALRDMGRSSAQCVGRSLKGRMKTSWGVPMYPPARLQAVPGLE